MNRQRIATIQLWNDTETHVLSVQVGVDRTFQRETQNSEQLQAQLIAPFVDAYKAITGKTIVGNLTGDLEPGIVRHCSDCNTEETKWHLEHDRDCKCGGVFK